MKLEILEGHSNYAVQPVKLTHFYPIEGADKIVRTVVFGNDVVIAKDSYKIGDTVLYFRSGTRLSEDYCKYNNLYESKENNLNQEEKGYISFRNRRVKAIKLRGVISDGMLMPIISIIPLLRDNIDLLHKTSKVLLERETIDGEELDKIIAGIELPPRPPKNGIASQIAASPVSSN